MSEMVERASKAYWSASAHWAIPAWETVHPKQQDAVRDGIRAAIAAMREPTEEMCSAPFSNGGYWDHLSPPAVWQAMIDAALADPPRVG